MHGIPHFAVSIALEKNGEVISGIICDPIKNETFYAEKGRGSYSIIEGFEYLLEKILKKLLVFMVARQWLR